MRLTRKTLVTAPTLTLVSAAEIEAQCNAIGIGATDFTPFVETATDHVATICDRAFLTQTWKGYLDRFPGDYEIELPLGQLQSVTSITYYDTNGTSAVYAASNYGVDVASDPGRIILEYQKLWPTVTLRNTNPIEVLFVCGWTSAAAVPAAIKHAIRLLAAHYYEHREEVVLGNSSAVQSALLSAGAESLLRNWRLY